MKYKVIEYLPEELLHICIDEKYDKIKLDLVTDGSINIPYNLSNELFDEKCKELIGKTIEVKAITPYTPYYLAINSKIIDE